MQKADGSIQRPYTITPSRAAALVMASWAGRPGVRGRVANAESRKETVQYLVSFCCCEQLINSLIVGGSYTTVKSQTGLLHPEVEFSSGEIFTK